MNYCPNCGTQAISGDAFCRTCGSTLNPASMKESAQVQNDSFRTDFAATFALALATAFFWLCQSFTPIYVFDIFSPLPGLLSILARITIVLSFILKSKNLLAVSAIASSSSLALGMIGSLPFGGNPFGSWAYVLTIVFSVSTLVSYFAQAKKGWHSPLFH